MSAPRVSDERLAELTKYAWVASQSDPDHVARERYEVALDLQTARATLDAMHLELAAWTSATERACEQRDRLREALEWFRDRAFCNISPAETIERVNAVLAPVAVRGGACTGCYSSPCICDQLEGGGENDAASGERATQGNNPARSAQPANAALESDDAPRVLAVSSAQAATPPPTLVTEAELLDLVNSGDLLEDALNPLVRYEPREVARRRKQWRADRARVLAAWKESR